MRETREPSGISVSPEMAKHVRRAAREAMNMRFDGVAFDDPVAEGDVVSPGITEAQRSAVWNLPPCGGCGVELKGNWGLKFVVESDGKVWCGKCWEGR